MMISGITARHRIVTIELVQYVTSGLDSSLESSCKMSSEEPMKAEMEVGMDRKMDRRESGGEQKIRGYVTL